MLKFGQISYLLLFLGLSLFASEPRITNLTVTPRYPWNGMVDITYSLECDDTESEWPVFFYAYDRNLDKGWLPMTSVTGDGVDERLKAGGPYKVVWDSAADYPDGHSSSLKVVANVGNYMVIDLTTGKSRYSATVPDLSNDTCRTTELWLRYIPAGTFTMGSSEDEVGRYDNETQHQVTLTEDYYIGVFEVTQRQYELITGTKPSYFNNAECYAGRPVEGVYYYAIRGTYSGDGWPPSHEVDERPFLGKLRGKTNLVFDLPTEAQWEYACRAGTTTSLNTGKNVINPTSEDANLNEAGRYFYNGGSGYSQGCDTSAGTAKVGSYLPNNWGLYDMHGNVWEWCLDRWQSDLGSAAATDPVGDTSVSSRVLRGGSWYFDARDCRSADRRYSNPSDCGDDFGFRVVLLP